MADFDDSKMYDPPESMSKEDYRREQDHDEARARKQIAEVTRAERAYRRENNIPLSAKTNPGYYHMDPKPSPVQGGNRQPGGSNEMIHNLNPLKLANGGVVHVPHMAGNHVGGNRSHQDYKK